MYLAIFFSVIVGIIATSPVPIIQKTFDSIFTEKDYFMLKVIPLALVALYVLKAILMYAQNLIMFGISWELVVQFREKLFVHIHRLPFGFFENNETGKLISRINNDVAIMQSTVTRLLKEFLQNSVTLIGLMIFVFYLKWDWALMALIVFPVMIFPVSNIGRKLKKFSHKGQEILGNINATILESFSGIKIVRAFGLEPRELSKFKNYNDDYLKPCKEYIDSIETPPIFLHIRQADNIGREQFHPILPISYFEDALKNWSDDVPCFVFTDDIDWCKSQEFFKQDRFCLLYTSDAADE